MKSSGSRLRIALIALSLVLSGRLASAGILVDQFPTEIHPMALVSDTSVPEYVATPFTLSEAAVVGGLTFWGTDIVSPVPDDFTVYFYRNNGGLPGSLIASEEINVAPTLFVYLPTTVIYSYDASLTPVSLRAGNYGLGIVHDSVTRSDTGWGWFVHDFDSTGAIAFKDPVRGPWYISTFGDMAFELTTPVTVPEPTSLALVLIGLVVLTSRSALRRHRI